MRDVPQTALDLITQTKDAGVRATFRKTLPVFEHRSITDSLGIVDPAWIDACNYYPGILRVTSVANVLYTQYVSDINGAWPAWTNTGIALFAGSRPAVDDGYVWYQKANGSTCYRRYSAWSTEVASGSVIGAPLALAAISDRVYALWQRNAGSYEIVSLNGQHSACYTIYGPTSMPRFDAVSFDGKEYFYTMDRDEGRIIEIVHVGNAISGQDSYGVGKAIVPIDAIDNVYGLKMGYASVIDGKVVVTGRLTRTSDDTAISFDVYAAGPENFSLGREMFVQGDYNVNGKMLRVGDTFVVSGAAHIWTAKATTVFGGTGHSDLEITTSDLANFSMQEAEGRSTNLGIDLSTALNHSAIAVGSDIVLEMAYGNNWTKLATCNLETDLVKSDTEGQSRMVSGVGKSAKRLAQWSPDQGVYVPSQAKMRDDIGNMTHVVRATGLWEKAWEAVDAPLVLKDLNKLGVLYATNRASRGGSMQASFDFPDDPYFKPYFGVAINYYREAAVEAAERLGVEVSELEDDMYGHNGLVAIYSKTEHNGTEGIALYLWKDSVMTKLTSASYFFGSDYVYWLRIEFVEGEIRVSIKCEDEENTFLEVIAYEYASASLPWKSDMLGRGAIVVKNIVPSIGHYGFSSTDTTLGVDNNTVVPSSGSLVIDNEVIAYNGRSAYNLSRPSGVAAGDEAVRLYWRDAVKPAAGFPTGERLIVEGNALSGKGDHYFNGASLVAHKPLVGDDGPLYSHGINNTFRILDYDSIAPEAWVPTTMTSGWKNFVGDAAYGSWFLAGDMAGFYVDRDPTYILADGGEAGAGPVSYVMVKPAIYLTGRGANDTSAVAHTQGTAHLWTSGRVHVYVAECYTQDEDQSLEDALKMIVGMSGGSAMCKAVIDETVNFAAAGVRNLLNDQTNFIATFDLLSITNGSGVGIAFRGNTDFSISSGWPVTGSGFAYYLEIQRVVNKYFAILYYLQNNGHIVLDTIPIRATNLNGAPYTNVPVGTVKVSVNDNYYSVWLNGRFVCTFYSEAVATSGKYIAFVSRQAASFKAHLSELDDLLADVVVGTRGNGMSVISELLADRHVLWRDNPDGSIYFYKSRDVADIYQLPDIVSAATDTAADDAVTRIRAEGLKISETYTPNTMKQYGNVFATVNARYANSVSEVREEANWHFNDNWASLTRTQLSMAVHPGLQPGDVFEWLDPRSNTIKTRAILGQSISVGFNGNNFVCDMQCDVVAHEA